MASPKETEVLAERASCCAMRSERLRFWRDNRPVRAAGQSSPVTTDRWAHFRCFSLELLNLWAFVNVVKLLHRYWVYKQQNWLTVLLQASDSAQMQ